MSARTKLVEQFESIATDAPNLLAIGDDNETLDFTALQARISEVQTFLRNMIGSEKAVVGFAVANGPNALATELAIWREGHAAMALPRTATLREAKDYLSVIVPALIVIAENSDGSVWPAAAAGRTNVAALGSNRCSGKFTDAASLPAIAGDLLQVQFTSGSSGKPKAVLFDDQSIAAALDQSSGWYDEFPNASGFSALPQHHAMGRAVVLEQISSGRGMIVTNTLAFGNHLKHIVHNSCGTLFCNPTYIRMILQLGLLKDLPDLRRVVLGTATVEPELPVEIRTQSQNVDVDIRYGVSESFGALTRLTLAPDAKPHKAGFVGHPLPAVTLHKPRNNPGPIVVSGSPVASAIIDQDELKELAGHDQIATGDNGSVDADGALTLMGRSNVFIKHRGYRIDPTTVESVIWSTGEVVDALVIGVPDKVVGEKVIAVVETGKNKTIDHDALIARCKDELSPHNIPSKIIQLSAIPRKPSGKPDREAARAMAIDKLQDHS